MLSDPEKTPEWFNVEAGKRCRVGNLGTFTGEQLAEGVAVQLEAGAILRLTVTPEVERGQSKQSDIASGKLFREVLRFKKLPSGLR